MLAFTPAASAQLVLDRLWVDLEAGGAAREDIVLRNESKERLYISLTPSEIVRPGMPDEERRQIADPEQLGLLISPSRLILDPGATRAVRIVSIAQPGDRDRVYRLLVNPEVSDVDAPASKDGERGVSIRVLTGYDVLVVARPEKPEPRVAAIPEANGAVLKNDGNTNVLLTDGVACANERADSCTRLPDYRLYAGAEWRIDTGMPKANLKFRRRLLADSESQMVEY